MANASIPPVPSGFNPATDGPALLAFLMEGCGWCLRLKPVISKVAATLGSVVPTYSVPPEHPLTRRYKVQGFPTLIYVDNQGRSTTYEGERTVDAITGFVCTRTANRLSVCRRRQ